MSPSSEASASQVVMDYGTLALSVRSALSTDDLWTDTLVIPVYLASASALSLALPMVLRSARVRRIRAQLLRSRDTYEPVLELGEATQTMSGLATVAKEHVIRHGGICIYSFKVATFVGCLGLLCLSIVTWALDTRRKLDVGVRETLFILSARFGELSDKEWVQLSEMFNFAYMCLLSFAALLARPFWSRLIIRHVNFLLFVTFAVYAYRDLFPLGTFTLTPEDLSEGWFLWAKIGLLSVTGILIPLLVPRPYIPFDPKEPMPIPNPEQVASTLSLVFWTFLDPVIVQAYKMPHLPHDQLPPIADEDFAKNLRTKSFPHLDIFTSGYKVHIFWRLMKVFRREYIVLIVMLIFRVLAGFLSPFGVNRLLNYMESHGDGAIVRPWVWIALIFVGPTMNSLANEYYLYIATRSMVRAEAIITQLIFEHALRIRVIAEADLTPCTDSTTVTNPVDKSAPGPEEGISQNPSASSGERILSASDTPTSRKQKQKAKDIESVTMPEVKSKNLTGLINNLVTTDLANITDARDFLYAVLYVPLQMILSVWFLYVVLGWSALVGLVVMFLLLPMPGYIVKRIQYVQKERMQRTDARVQAISETLSVIRMVKLFSWESRMNQRLAERREEELKWIWKHNLLEVMNEMINYLIPIFILVATYSTYTLIMKQELKASAVYSSMAVFNMLQSQLFLILVSVVAAVKGRVSLDRLNNFLQATELLDSFSTNANGSIGALVDREARLPEGSIGIRNASFSWSNKGDGSSTPSQHRFMLRIEEELMFTKDEINIILGPTGSGKTSLLMALLGEMHYIPSNPDSWFNLPRGGGLAYAAQESWVQNETIRDNIIFGAAFDEDRYKKVLYQCGLEQDLSLFAAGDNTEVGEKGIALSGGQKARITLARAVYSQAKILLLDDVLAALDVHTAKWVIDKCFRGDLIAGRTVLLVTHNVTLATSIARFVVSLGSDGRIISQGSVLDVLGRCHHLADGLCDGTEVVEKAEKDVSPVELAPNKKQTDGKFVVAEAIAKGHVSWAAIKLFVSALSEHHVVLFWATCISSAFGLDISNSFQTWWLGYWATQYEIPNSEVAVSYYLSIYVAILGISVLFYCSSSMLYRFGKMRASREIHKWLIESVTGTTMRWLDITPTSRVITRCTQDIREVDGAVAWGLWSLVQISATLIIKLGAVILFSPMFAFPGIFIAFAGGSCGMLYMKAQLSVKREMSNARGPVLGHFGAAIAGLTSLRAYGAEEAFRMELRSRIDHYSRAARVYRSLNRWIGVRIQVLSSLFTSGLAAYLVYYRLPTAANTGFSLNMALGFSGMILSWVRIFNVFELSANSLERILAYISIEQELKPTKEGTPPAYWPASGDLRVENLSARYSSDGPAALRNISFHIKSGERVGVVGRTGSGKTTLTLALLRCIYTHGNVYYDGIPTSSINLDALRSNITIIPQMPELLGGTLRQNLDPFDQHDDATLNNALCAAGLFSLQRETDQARITLETAISSGGSNLSMGQRQILALARAIVRGSKLFILDEATSAIDYQTDSVIQSSLRRELRNDVTLLTIAHRLQTIMDYDKIMVLDAGEIVELNKPSELLKNPEGLFRALVEESGEKDKLYAMAGGG